MKNKKKEKIYFIFNNNIGKEILEWLFCIIVAIIVALLFRYYIGTPTVVKKVSMYPTLIENQRLWLNRWNRTTKVPPKRGDIITFEAPSKISYTKKELGENIIDENEPIAKYEKTPVNIFEKFTYYVLEIGKESYIKRVIALPGEHVEIKEGKVFINGENLQEDYLQDGIVTDVSNTELCTGFDDFIVPDNCIFAMGDNRTHSTDCRAFGCIPLEKIEGIAKFRIWPLNKLGKI